MTDRVLLAEGKEKGPEVGAPDSGQAWRACALAGAALSVAGWANVVLIWLPLQFGNGEWEFATVSSMLDAMPLATIGVALLVAAGLARGWHRRRNALGVFAAVVVIWLMAAMVLYALNAPLAWRGIEAGYRPILKKALVKAAILSATYVLFYAGIVWLTLRQSKRPTGGA